MRTAVSLSLVTWRTPTPVKPGTSLTLSFTPLHKLEVGNAFELGVFRGLFSAADSNAAQANLDQGLA